jgi:hypothetical protein
VTSNEIRFDAIDIQPIVGQIVVIFSCNSRKQPLKQADPRATGYRFKCDERRTMSMPSRYSSSSSFSMAKLQGFEIDSSDLSTPEEYVVPLTCYQ